MTEPHADIVDRPDWFPDHLFPFDSHFVEVAGCHVHYVDEGSGPVLLLLHGNPTWSFLYRKMIPVLRDHFRCIALDYPGFGLSRAPEGYDYRPRSHSEVVEGFIDRLQLRSLTLMGQDWGGPIGLGVAVRRPKLFRSFVLGDTWAWPVDDDLHFRWFSQALGGKVGAFFIRRYNAFVNVMLPVGTRRRHLSREEMEAYRRPFPDQKSREPTRVFPREITASRAFLAEVEAGLPGIADRPLLLVWGDRDPAFRRRERERFEEIFDHHRTHVLAGAGHFIQEDAPGEIAQYIVQWWEEDVEPVE